MSNLANMSDDLGKAQVLVGKLPSPEVIKIHLRQCSKLQIKLLETLELVEKEKASCRYPALYSKVFHELFLVVRRVKTFIDDCCYKRDGDFVLAAIKVSAHKERFVKYYVELDWCIFLIKCIKYAKGEPVSSGSLQGFQWKEKVNSLLEDTRSIVEKDFSDFKDTLRQYVKRPGGHQRICATLLRRFKDETDILPSVPDDDLGVPPVESTKERIGKGGFGKVYSFKWKNRKFAIKIPSSSTETLDREVAILEKCCHPNIVNLILFHKKPDGKQYLMMEKLSMNLLEYVKSVAKGFSFLEAVDMILQVCEGMQYLSEKHHVSHRDMKPGNILVKLESGQDGPVLELQVADFGLAKVREALEMTSKNTPNVGTTKYRAPEMTGAPGPGEDKIRGESLKADMYSFAVTCSCILTGSEPYVDILENPLGMGELRHYVKKGGRPRLPDDCPPELSSLLQECWHPEPSKRPASFSEICEKLRKVKAKLLTCDVHKGDEVGSSSQENGRITFNSGDRPLRILALGNSNAVEAAIISICGASGHIMEDNIRLKESMSALPPMCLYRGATKCINDSIDFTDIMTFVEVRNKRWHHERVKAAWKEDLYYPRNETALFPNSSSRLHMVWYICTRLEDLPNALQWDDITKKLNGLPVQMLVTETNEYKKIQKFTYRFFDESQNLEDLIIKVDLTDAAAKERLWKTCWEVKTRAEIKNAATVIGAIRKELGSHGIVIPVGVVAKKPKAFSVEQSKEFILNFLCTYWDVPQNFVDVLLSRIKAQQTPKFVSFCLQNAAAILYREREHIHGLVPAELRSEFLEGEAQSCFEAYFRDLDLSACDKMKFRDIQGFLKAVFDGEGVPCPLVSGLDRNLSFFKVIELLRGKGH